MNPIVLDIETRPDPAIALSDEWWANRREKIEPDGRLKDPLKIAEDIDRKLDGERAKMALGPVTGLIACIGWQAWNDEEPTVLTVPEATRAGELALLKQFAFRMPQHPDLLITWNGRSFDVPFVIGRCAIQDVRLPWWAKPRDYRLHLDLYDDLGLQRGLSAWQFAMGGGFKEVDGADTLELPLDQLATHCNDDVVQTMVMAHRTSHVWMPRSDRT